MELALMGFFVVALGAAGVVTLAIAGVYLRAVARVLAWVAASAALWMGGDKNVWRNWCAEANEIGTGLTRMQRILSKSGVASPAPTNT